MSQDEIKNFSQLSPKTHFQRIPLGSGGFMTVFRYTKHLCVLVTLFLALPVFSFNLDSGEKQVALLELFSSEGCSSCPPAEKWMAELKTHPELFKSFVPLEYHVDYWNQLGWVDPYSNKQFSERQKEYAQSWLYPRMYTPGFVFNGDEWSPQQNLTPSNAQVGKLLVEHQGGGKFAIRFVPKNKDELEYKFWGAVLGHGLEQKVKSGENAGKTLRHEFVVLGLAQADAKSEKNQAKGVIQLQSPLLNISDYSVVFWVSQANRLKALQAVGKKLSGTEIKMLGFGQHK